MVKKAEAQSFRFHVAFIDFRKRMTLSLGNNSGHICVDFSAMPSTLLSVIKHMYENDEYIFMDGEEGSGASHEWCQTGVPSVPSPFLFVHQ